MTVRYGAFWKVFVCEGCGRAGHRDGLLCEDCGARGWEKTIRIIRQVTHRPSWWRPWAWKSWWEDRNGDVVDLHWDTRRRPAKAREMKEEQ